MLNICVPNIDFLILIIDVWRYSHLSSEVTLHLENTYIIMDCNCLKINICYYY